MKFIWEEGDIVGGLHIIQPKKGITAVIGWLGTGGDRRSVIMETNTDGMVHFQHEKEIDSEEFAKRDGELVSAPFTKAELADRLNNATYHWVPASIFEGNGAKLLYSGTGTREETRGAYNVREKQRKKYKD